MPTFAGMHEASRAVCGATLAAIQAVHSGAALHAVNLAGGLHHAMPGAASGFCVYNDIAVGIQWLLDQGVERVAYVDVDVHHGDGVQAAFWDDPRVLTVSVHESGRALFPGTGFPSEVGGPEALGYAVNVALPPHTGDEGWLRAFDGVVPALLHSFKPQILVTQQGCDSHAEDPLAHLELSVDGQRMSYAALHALAHEVCDGRWVALGGGGYSWVDVVPRAWSHLIGEVVGSPVPPETPLPAVWRDFVEQRLKVPTPALMTDGNDAARRGRGSRATTPRTPSTPRCCAPVRPSSPGTASTPTPTTASDYRPPTCGDAARRGSARAVARAHLTRPGDSPRLDFRHTFPTSPVRHYPRLQRVTARVVAGAVGKPVLPRAV